MHSCCNDIVNRTNGTDQGWTESPGQAIGQRLDPRGCRHVLNVGWRTARASNGGLEAEPPPGSRGPGHRVRKLYGVCKSIGVDTSVCRKKTFTFLRICVNPRSTLWQSGVGMSVSTPVDPVAIPLGVTE